jgi:renal tumor antigen
MDIWSVGCVMFEVMSLYPLFPGANELDQINKIHEILGTPAVAVLNKIRKNSSHFKANFPYHAGKGLAKMLPSASQDCIDVLQGMLEYDPDARLSARQCLKHPYFKELRAEDKRKARESDGKHMARLETKATVAAGIEVHDMDRREKGPSLTKQLRTKLSLRTGANAEKEKRGFRSLKLRKAKTTQDVHAKADGFSGHPLLARRLTTKATAGNLNKDGNPKLPPLLSHRQSQRTLGGKTATKLPSFK